MKDDDRDDGPEGEDGRPDSEGEKPTVPQGRDESDGPEAPRPRDDRETGPDEETVDHSSDRAEPASPRRRSDDPEPKLPELPPRYVALEELGSGGQGAVLRVHDRELGRDVALKTIHADRHSPEETSFFLREARSAAALEHPNVVPIHDLGELPDGRPYYTMRLVSGRDLADVLRSVQAGEAAGWTLIRLIGVVQQLSRGLQAAHEVGLVHRDVKPANILIGALDEVLVVDWGIAKGTDGGPQTTTGVVKGTVHYLAPEQARGENATPAADLHAIGVLLYQVLTLRLPYEANTSGEIIAAILRDAPIPPSEVEDAPWAVPPELESLTMRLLAKDPADRPRSASEVADELRAFLEGLAERERREASAIELIESGRKALGRHDASQAELAGLREEIARLEDEHPPWQPVEEKLPLIDARAMAEELERGAWTSFLEGVNRYTDALVHVPDHREARAALADLFWERFTGAEERREEALAETCRMLVERWHGGRYSRELEGHGRIELEVFPKNAELVLHPLVEKNLVLVDGPGQALGQGDVEMDDVPMGSYVIVATAPGHEPARYPVCIRRCETWTGELRLLEEGALPEGFVYIPGAEVWLGGDPLATNSWPRHRVKIESFAIGRHPVTFGQWCDYLDSGQASDADLPRTETAGAICEQIGGRYEPIRGVELSRLVNDWEVAPRTLPVFGIDSLAAGRYAAWRGSRLGEAVRLPQPGEWEFASRGADERVYPWGQSFDPSACHMRDSLHGEPDVAPVGHAGIDESVHGVRDLAGCIQELTNGWFDETRRLVEVRGGGWGSGEAQTRSCWRGVCVEDARNPLLGLRLALPVAG